jgi:hypothetical protein
MPAGANFPSLPQVQSATFTHLTDAADSWAKSAELWESAFTEVREATLGPGGTDWEGAGAEAAQNRTDRDVVPVRAAASQLREAASIARHGAGQMEANQRAVLQAVDDARADGFWVGGDYTITDTQSGGTLGDCVARRTVAGSHSHYIQHQLSMFAGADMDIASKIDAATRGLDKIRFTERSAPHTASVAFDAMPAAPDIPLGITVLCVPGPRGGPYAFHCSVLYPDGTTDTYYTDDDESGGYR